jgi:hypothetical protein
MGNFISKEDILVEIAVLFKQMDNGNLSIEELEELVKLSRDLNERILILRYKAFEEKVFGVRPVPTEVPEIVEEVIIQEAPILIIEEPTPTIEVVVEEIIIEESTIEEEAPLFKLDVKDEPSFGFSLFGSQLDEIEEEKINVIPEVKEVIIETPVNETSNFEEPVKEEIEESDSYFNSEHSSFEEEVEKVESEIPIQQPMSDVEKAHLENLARFFEKKKEESVTEAQVNINPVAPSPVAPQFIREEENFEIKNEIIEEIQPTITQQIIPDSVIQTPVIEEQKEEQVGQFSSFSYGDLAVFIHKYNQVDSNIASQFGVTKIQSLIGSFGINERLQFINELFDGSSEDFSNAIKTLDQQVSSENARTKVAEFAVSNNWDVESETVAEFMQKIIRRYA